MAIAILTGSSSLTAIATLTAPTGSSDRAPRLQRWQFPIETLTIANSHIGSPVTDRALLS